MIYDFKVTNCRVIDGTGNTWFHGDVATKGDSISGVGRVSGPASVEVDGEGLVVCPGFIDIHTHSDGSLIVDGRGLSKVFQGVTTEVTGNCGSSLAPLDGEAVDDAARDLEKYGVSVTWRTMNEYCQVLRGAGLSLNAAPLVGHGTLRGSTVGYVNRKASPGEMKRMKEMLDQALSEGAWGLSTGLIYPPSQYADAEELVNLSYVLPRFDGVYASHIRGEASELIGSVDEAIDLGERTGVRVQISHHKAVGPTAWGKIHDTIGMISSARRQGVDVTFDVYPYTATATSLTAILPEWAADGGVDHTLKRLKDPTLRDRLRGEIESYISATGTWDGLFVSRVGSGRTEIEGKSMAEIAQDRGQSPADATLDLLVEEDAFVGMISFCLQEEDVKSVVSHPLSIIGSDGSAICPDGPLGHGKPHPRSYGTFSRVLGHYVREEGSLSLEEAIRKMTSFPASRIGLRDRGLLVAGMKADIVVFDPAQVSDTATFQQPHSLAKGVRYLLVNGVEVISDSRYTGERPGRVLLRGQ